MHTLMISSITLANLRQGREELLEEYVTNKDRFRVSSSPVVPMPPFENIMRGEDWLAAKAHYQAMSLESQVLDILGRHGIPWISCGLRRQVRILTKDRIQMDILRIGTNNEAVSLWKAATVEICSFLEARSRLQNVVVEISNDKHSKSRTSYTIGHDPLILSTLHQLKPKILEELDSSVGLAWTSLAFHRRSAKGNQSEEARVPTMMLYCQPESSYGFTALEARLYRILDASKLSLYLEILPGIIISGADTHPSSSSPAAAPLQGDIRNGASIGIKGDGERAGSLGFWAWAHLPGRHEPQKVACTAFHVVIDSNVDLKELTMAEGVTLENKDAFERVTVESPAYTDKVRNILELEKAVQARYDPHLVNKLATARQQMVSEDSTIGKVVMASGVRLNKSRRRMDWALFTTPTAFQQNHVPSPTLFIMRQERPLNYDFEEQFVMSKFGEIQNGDWVTKNGRTTGTTAGYVNQMERIVFWPEYNMTSSEIEVVGLAAAFAERGDSGSAVINMHGELIGIVIAMEMNSTSEHSGIVTSIGDLLRDLGEREGVTLRLP